MGFLPALPLIVAGSMAGALNLRHASGSHIAPKADSLAVSSYWTGISLLIPGFITDALGLLLLFYRCGSPQARRSDAAILRSVLTTWWIRAVAPGGRP